MSIGAIIVAAGRGERAGGEIPKQFRLLGGKPVLAWSVAAFRDAGVEALVVVAPPGETALCREIAGPGLTVVEGGASRTDSVRAGLNALGRADVVLIHDAARPGVQTDTVLSLVHTIEAGAPAVAPALPVADALKRTQEGGATEEVDRAGLMRVQTPQAFAGPALRAAYASLPAGLALSDDLEVVRRTGAKIVYIPGDERLLKLTYPRDFETLERMLDARIICVGSGFDAHRFGEGDHVTLCGVRIAHAKGLAGHSDADVAWHALVDAILGAIAQGDIGAHFPPSDPTWKGADSETFLRQAVKLAAEAGARINNVDVTLICERPKVGPHRDAMRARTAEILGIPVARVAVKATTTEKMGFTGREEGVAAQATATLSLPA